MRDMTPTFLSRPFRAWNPARPVFQGYSRLGSFALRCVVTPLWGWDADSRYCVTRGPNDGRLEDSLRSAPKGRDNEAQGKMAGHRSPGSWHKISQSLKG